MSFRGEKRHKLEIILKENGKVRKATIVLSSGGNFFGAFSIKISHL